MQMLWLPCSTENINSGLGEAFVIFFTFFIKAQNFSSSSNFLPIGVKSWKPRVWFYHPSTIITDSRWPWEHKGLVVFLPWADKKSFRMGAQHLELSFVSRVQMHETDCRSCGEKEKGRRRSCWSYKGTCLAAVPWLSFELNAFSIPWGLSLVGWHIAGLILAQPSFSTRFLSGIMRPRKRLEGKPGICLFKCFCSSYFCIALCFPSPTCTKGSFARKPGSTSCFRGEAFKQSAEEANYLPACLRRFHLAGVG